MRISLVRLSALVLAASSLAAPARAQIIGNPVYFDESGGTGLTVSADYGRGINKASLKGNYFGARATFGLPIVAITASVGSFKPNGATSSAMPVGGDVAVIVVRGPAVPLTVALQGGVRYYRQSGTQIYHVPAGLALTLNVPSPGVSVEPWVAPRLDYTRVSVGGVSESATRPGASAGLNVGLPAGVGFHVAIDYVNHLVFGGSPLIVGAGVHYAIRVPSHVPGAR
jgi:hypothetical protein